ncbi:MAG: hypothetical protein IIB85_02435 [Chloroflexi bacterium]|nr:hypothetical protein [Chloroflexota bacterium]
MGEEDRGRSFIRRQRPDLGDEGRRVEEPEPQDESQRPVEEPERPPREASDRIVVPHQERDRRDSPVDVELREVRWGATSRGAYLRVVPSQQRFTRVGAGHIAATRVGSRPVGRVERIVQAVKGTVLGSPIATAQSIHERLTKLKALAILGSDPLSSSAYATEEALILLTFAGAAGLDYLLPIGFVVAALLILVMMSYRQTIKAYPGGGGAYAVSHDNLGRYPGLVAAGAARRASGRSSIESPYRAFAGPMLAYIDSLERAEGGAPITVILPGFRAHHWWESLLHNQAIRRLRPFLDEHKNVRILDFDYDVRVPDRTPSD